MTSTLTSIGRNLSLNDQPSWVVGANSRPMPIRFICDLWVITTFIHIGGMFAMHRELLIKIEQFEHEISAHD